MSVAMGTVMSACVWNIDKLPYGLIALLRVTNRKVFVVLNDIVL